MENPIKLTPNQDESTSKRNISIYDILNVSEKAKNYKMGYMIFMPLIIWAMLFTLGQMVYTLWETGFYNNVRLLSVNTILLTIAVFISISIHRMWGMFINDVMWSENKLEQLKKEPFCASSITSIKEYKKTYAGDILIELTLQAWLLVLMMLPMMFMAGDMLKGLWILSSLFAVPVLLFSHSEYQHAKDISQHLTKFSQSPTPK